MSPTPVKNKKITGSQKKIENEIRGLFK